MPVMWQSWHVLNTGDQYLRGEVQHLIPSPTVLLTHSSAPSSGWTCGVFLHIKWTEKCVGLRMRWKPCSSAVWRTCLFFPFFWAYFVTAACFWYPLGPLTISSYKAFCWRTACLSTATLTKHLPYVPQAAVRLVMKCWSYTQTHTPREGELWVHWAEKEHLDT